MKNAYANFQLNRVDDSLSKAYLFEADLFYYDNTSTRVKRDDWNPPPSPAPLPSPRHHTNDSAHTRMRGHKLSKLPVKIIVNTMRKVVFTHQSLSLSLV
jgi:hypothetical protein